MEILRGNMEELERKLIQKEALIKELEGKLSLLTGENERLIHVNNDKLKEIEIF